MHADPFAVLDQEGVGALMKWAIQEGRKTRPGIKLGICGEHGGEPSSVAFCHDLGLNYVSCSPYRVPDCQTCLRHKPPSTALEREEGQRAVKKGVTRKNRALARKQVTDKKPVTKKKLKTIKKNDGKKIHHAKKTRVKKKVIAKSTPRKKSSTSSKRR